jgi:hypothetical protein
MKKKFGNPYPELVAVEDIQYSLNTIKEAIEEGLKVMKEDYMSRMKKNSDSLPMFKDQREAIVLLLKTVKDLEQMLYQSETSINDFKNM